MATALEGRQRWENAAKQRYYELLVCRDLFGATVVIRTWGRIGSAEGSGMEVVVADDDELATVVERTSRRRRDHGYVRIEPGVVSVAITSL